jgi:uncharacterized protein YutE (UPF0331/DUF86 family)
MDERIEEHLMRLNRYRLQLAELGQVPLEEFKGDDLRRSAAERRLHLAIESCINIGNRLLSLIQLEKPVKTPETYADIFLQLGALGIVTPEFAERLVRMAKFRNRLVHLYWEVDVDTLYRILQENIADFKTFQDIIVNYFNEKAHLSNK